MTHHLSLILPLVVAGTLLAADDVAPGMNRFAVSAYHQLAQGKSNVIFSPFSISTALSMLLAGARGQTESGIKTALDQQASPGYHAAVAALAAELVKQGNAPGNQLAIANGLWLQLGLTLQPDFSRIMQQVYQAPLTPLDFQHKPEQARQEINSWTAKQTHDRIQEMFASGSIDDATRLVLTSAIYFYGKWLSPFDPANTRPDVFTVAPGNTVNAKFMNQTANFLYGETPQAQILEMKYAGTPFVMDIVLPRAKDGLPVVEHSFEAGTLSGWFKALTMHHVDTAVPRFRAESSFSLREMLSRLGMADAFGRNADLSGIDGHRDLYIGKVVHKAFVEVSEAGTEAAAATGIGVRAMAMRRMEEATFHADHPFAFFIRDISSGVIVFAGRLMNPSN